MPEISEYFKNINPSAVRTTQIEFAKRTDKIKAINGAIGNVSLPLHPALYKRMNNLSENKAFKKGVVQYTSTIGLEETNAAFINIIGASGFDTSDLYSQVTDGGSQAMDLLLLGCCGSPGTEESPMLLIDPAYTNYASKAIQFGRKAVSITRFLDKDGAFDLPNKVDIETFIRENKPGCLVVIPYDNPTGSFLTKDNMIMLAELCVKYDMWMISDEAYREAYYTDDNPVSIWGLTNILVPGIEGLRISVETASKMWNGCGLRIGALVTDNKDFHQKAVASNTPNLCSNAIGQYIFGALASVSHVEIQAWYKKLRVYYKDMMDSLYAQFSEIMPRIIFSKPDAAFYSIIDLRNIAGEDFDAMDFAIYCAREGSVNLDNEDYTLLLAPMSGFYNVADGQKNPGQTQLRISYVEVPEKVKKIPMMFKKLFEAYQQHIKI